MIGLTRPKFFLPVHEHRMLVKHAETAQSMGIPANMLIIQNGDVVEVSESGIASPVKSAGVELVDTSGSGMVSGKVLGAAAFWQTKASLQWRRRWIEWQADEAKFICEVW